MPDGVGLSCTMSTTDVVRITSQQPSNNDKEQGKSKVDQQCHKRRGALKAPSESSHQGRRCARCRAPFGRIYNIGASCPRCGHRVCQQCRESRVSNDKGTVAVEWLCAVCHKVTELHEVSATEWTYEAGAAKRTARRKNNNSPINIFKRSIRRSWTINGPPTRWSVTRRSPELRIYQSLPARCVDYRQVVQVDSTEPSILRVSNAIDADRRNEESVGLPEIEARSGENLCGLEAKSKSEFDLNKRTNSKQSENSVSKNDEEASSLDNVKVKRNDQLIVKTDVTEPVLAQEQASPRISLIKPPRILPKLGTPDIKPVVKHGERKSNIPVFRRSSKEFEDIKSPQESAKRSLIPQRYRGSTDDLRRSREDISVPSLIPKLFSAKTKEDRLKRQDSRDEIRHIPKASRRDVKESKEDSKISSSQANGRDDSKTGIRIFRRNSREDVGRESTSTSTNIGRIRYSSKEERQERIDCCVGEESRSRSGTNEQGKAGTRALKRESREETEVKVVEGKASRSERTVQEEIVNRKEEAVRLAEMANEQVKVEERIDETEEKVTRERDEAMKERTEEEERANLAKQENVEEAVEEVDVDVKNVDNSTLDVGDGSYSNEVDAAFPDAAKKRETSLESSHGRRMEDFQVVRRKFSKEEYSNLDDNDDVPNRRCSSHLSPEASPLSTRSSRYSPRESESEPTPALSRKIGSGDSALASQRIRDAITRTRRESNSSARYESSGSESVRLSEPGLRGYADLARRVKFGGSGSGIGNLAGSDEVVHRDSATSAGEDEPHDDNYSRDPRIGPASSQTRTMLRRRRQFDAQGSRRRGRSHARGCADELQSLQTLHVIGRGGGRQPSPPGAQGQGQEAPIVDYRRLVFISSDSSSGREEDDADSSSGSSSLNGLARGGNAQGLEDCDWDYFESGVIPLPLNVSINTSNVGTDTVNQDWSCCPGRGSSSCQACGGSRGANVLPVPVPIPVPVPYPVPVPAALWTRDFATSSVIGCGSAAEGSLVLRGEPNAPWFAWHPRFSHALHGAGRLDPRLTTGAFDPVTFAFRPEVHPEVASRQYAGVETSTSTVAESINSVQQEGTSVNEVGTTGSLDASNEESKANVPSTEVTAENQSEATVDEEVPSVNKDPVERLLAVNEQAAQNSLSSFGGENRDQKMFRRGDSGSSSGRSSADSSDLEDSASHHFSRVFVVNDDSLTSDNDIEDNEDSDSAKEGGVTLKRVSALPEDEPVILRHVRLLDEDASVEKSREGLSSNYSDDKEKVKRSVSLEDPATVVIDNSTSDQNRRMDYFLPEASEIYLADSEDCSDSHVELKSIRILDPDSIESSSTAFNNVADRCLLEKEYRPDGNEANNDDVSLFDAKNQVANGANFATHLAPSSIDLDSSIIIPDSLEVSALAINSSTFLRDNVDNEEDEEEVESSRGLPSSDISGGEIKPDLPAVNSDKAVIRADKPAALSVVLNGSLNSSGLELCKTMSDLSNGGNSNVSSTGESASSETNTGSEVSSDELHEYEVFAIENNEGEFGAINRKLILNRSFDVDQKIASGSEDVWNRTRNQSTRFEGPKDSCESSVGNEDSVEAISEPDVAPNVRTMDLFENPIDTDVNVISDRTEPRVLISVNKQQSRASAIGSEKCQGSTNPDDSECRHDHSVGDIISSKIHEIFKNVDNANGAAETVALAKHDESDTTVGERPGLRQVGGGVRCGGGSNGETERGGTARFRSVERRPPTRKDGFLPGSTKDSSSFPSNKYRSLVMITQGAYQPVSVVTSDTTTLLQPDEHQPPQGLAGYFQLALEAAAEPHRNGQGPRRPLMIKRVATPAQTQPETEADSGLSVGSASESDDVQSVKSVGSRIGQGAAGVEHNATKTCAGSQGVPEQVSSQTNDLSGVRGRVNSQQQQQGGNAPDSSDIVILEEGLADDDSWVEEVSHDEEDQGGTTATEESSEDEANNLGDREEELRGYHRQAIDFTLHTIVEESCEESEAEPSLAAGSPRKQRPPSASELEKYFFFGLGEGNANLGSREVDSLSETSSIYSEGLESLGQEEATSNGDKTSGEFLNSSRLEKYFLSEFLGFDQDRRDSDGSVGSDSEGRPSPEQRRKRLVRARGTGRSHSSSLDNLLALAQSSQNLSSQNSLQDLSLNQDSQGTQSEGSSTETDGADDQSAAFGTDGQFDTVKRKKKKPTKLGTQSPRVPEDRNKTPEPREIVEIAEGDTEMINSEDERSKTPQPEGVLFSPSSSQIDTGRAAQLNSGESNGARTKQQSRDSGFVGSCDDLIQHQKTSGDGQTVGCQDSAKDSCQNEEGIGSKNEKNASKVEVSVGQSTVAPPPAASLSRKDSFNNWSSDEETNLMMSKMRQFFKTMVANSNGQNQNSTNNSSGASPAPSPRLSGNSPKMRLGSQNRTKPPQLVYFENELTRLMKTVPGIRDEQVREIVEYLSSEDTWSDSYDSSDYTSSDLEGAGGRRSALQEQISQSCQQIISKFDTTVTETLSDREKEGRPTSDAPQPLGRDTAFVYQKLVQSFTKMAGDGVSSDASSTPHSSPPLIAKVMHHIGSRLVALMHEVSEGGPAVQPHSWRRYPQHHRTPSSASTTEDDDSTSDSTNAPVHLQLPRSKSHDPLLLLNGHPTTTGQEGEEREASDYERFSWRGSFESALMAADSRTKLSLLACSGDVSASASASALAMAAKRRSAGDLLFNPKSFSREQLDRVRSCGSIGGGTGSTEEKIWSNRRRSSVPDANTRGESGASAGDDDTEDELEYGGDPRATTLPRGMQAAAAAASAATNSLPRLPAIASAAPGGSMSMHKAHSVYHFLPQHTGVKSARYRPPGFARNSLGNATGSAGPKRAVSAPGLQVSGSQATAGKRDNSRSRRQQAMSLTSDDGSSLSEACSTPIIGAGSRTGSNTVDDDMDRGLHSGHLATRASLSSLGARSDSMASVYSGAGEGRWCGSVAVRGEVEFALQYDYKQLTFEVHITQCRDLAPVDVKRNRSDPYVKVYLLPDKSKSGKRKTKVKKHTLNPVFDETLKFHMSLNGLETRTLWLTVWHSDMFGRNDFLGEVRMPLENKIFDDPTPRWYPLQERTEPFDDPVAYKGEVIVGLKFVPPDPAQQQERERELGVDQRGASKTRKNWSRGALHVLVKEARNLQTRAKHSGTCDPFCKSYLLPDKGRSGKQKTGVVRRCSGGSPVWGHTFIYKDVSLQELAERGLELTVWDHDRIASNEFLGGVRFNLGTGKHYGKPVDWMDATGRELSLWQSMLERPNFWVEGAVTLRPNLHNHGKNTF